MDIQDKRVIENNPRVEKKNSMYFQKIASVVFVIVCVFGLGVYTGYTKQPVVDKIDNILNPTSEYAPKDVVDFNEFWKVWKLLDEKYPHSKDRTNQERVWGAINGLVASMKDPYTVYFTPDESKIFNDEITGSFSGIGVEIGIKDGFLTVIAPLKNSPAERAGMKAGDIITKVDEHVVADMSVDESIKYIRGEKGTNVIITVYRKDVSDPIPLTVTRDIISIPTIDEVNLGDTYLISLYNFNASSADLFHKALLSAKQQKKKNIIIDLRGNPGGYLEAAVSIASEILPEGALIVTEDYGKTKKTITHRSSGYGTISSDIKIVVLIDQGSASASEILAGALGDSNRATLIGEKSFGKGSVQELMSVSPTTSIKITVADWITPNGSIITGKGIEPAIVVSQDDRVKDPVKDPTILRALEFIRTGKK
jgi:carboxyl-terminal processing protease